MLDSVRVGLTVWYTGVMACVLVVLAAAAYFVLRENSVRRMDASIVEMAESFLSTVSAELNGAPGAVGLKQGVASAIVEHRFGGTVFVVLDERGEIVGASEERLPKNESDKVTAESLRGVASWVLAEAHPFHTIRVGGDLTGVTRDIFRRGKAKARWWFCSRCIARRNFWRPRRRRLRWLFRWRCCWRARAAIFWRGEVWRRW